ncbi:hypothetical protein Pan181_48530 [Aeoliella mucimassa]|uniref:HEPN domain-containing protein n=2 Tax=Aeoliella mucimassa TaxID=2527972 RepID=A0A518AV61_9BACT|nr:hypothetical protein Pan181_48530 [Aeoliella mucimassa]
MSKYKPGSLFDEPPVGVFHDQMACVGTNGGPYQFDDFAHGYFEAARRISASLVEDVGFIDILVYPIAFLYRQGLELAIKHLIYFLSPHYGAGSSPVLNHGIINNWKILRPLIESHATIHPHRELARKQLDGIEAIVTDFDKFDPKSFVFRYPEDKSGGVYIKDHMRIDVALLIQELTLVINWFENVVTGTREDLIA